MAKKVLSVGDKVPDFTAASSAGGEFSLADHKGRRVVLYFYPKDSTPGCTLEGQEFNKLLGAFKKLNTEVYGVSRDSLKSHGKFIDKCGFKFDLLSDEDEALCKIFDVIHEKNMYGKKMMGVVRSTFLIDEKGKLAAEWRKVKAEGHAKEVLEAVKNAK